MADSATLQELVVRIKADASALEAGMRNAESITKGSASRMASAFDAFKSQMKELIPAITLVGIEEFARRSVEAGVELAHLAEKTGIEVETLSALDLVVRQNGSSIQELANGIKFMNRNISEAANGNTEAAKSFLQLGLNVQQLNKLSTTEQFLKVMDALSNLEKASDRTNAGMKVLGRGFQDLGALATQGADGIRKALQYAEQIGAVITREDAENLKDFNSQWQIFVVLAERFAQSGFASAFRAAGDAIGYFSTSLKATDYSSIYAAEGKLQGLLQARASMQKALDSAQSANPGAYPEHFGDQNKALADQDAKIKEFQDRIKEIKTLQEGMNNPGGDKKGGTGLINLDENVVDRDIRKLKEEEAVLQAGNDQRESLKAYYQIINDAKEKGVPLSDAEIARIKVATDEYGDLAERMKTVTKVREQLSDGLADLVINFKSAGDAAKSFFDDIAKTLLKKSITDPLANSVTGLLKGTSLGKMLGFASGGNPPVGVPSIVGEHGPEVFVPTTAGTVIPNNAAFGSSRNRSGPTIVMSQSFNLNPGATEQTVASLRNLVPQIVSMTHASVFQAIQNGGTEARIVGARS